MDNLDSWVREKMAVYDPDNRHGFPYIWGTTGFAHNIDLINECMPDVNALATVIIVLVAIGVIAAAFVLPGKNRAQGLETNNQVITERFYL